MPHHSVEGEFADDERAQQIDMDLFGREEQADCHRQIVCGTFFAKIGWARLTVIRLPQG